MRHLEAAVWAGVVSKPGEGRACWNGPTSVRRSRARRSSSLADKCCVIIAHSEATVFQLMFEDHFSPPPVFTSPEHMPSAPCLWTTFLPAQLEPSPSQKHLICSDPPFQPPTTTPRSNTNNNPNHPSQTSQPTCPSTARLQSTAASRDRHPTHQLPQPDVEPPRLQKLVGRKLVLPHHLPTSTLLPLLSRKP